MAQRLATVGGYALRPGVSLNGRLYTTAAIAKMVERAQARITAGDGLDITRPAEPLAQRTHHAADDDSTRIVGRLTSMSVAEDGSARFSADIADTTSGRDIAALISPHDPTDPASVPPFLRGVSIRGAWVGAVQRVQHNGRTVETADDLELDGLDYTGQPGVPGAGIDQYTPAGSGTGRRETTGPAPERVLIFESVQEATVSAPVDEKGAPALKSGRPAAAQTKASAYADPGYQDDKAPRYALDTKAQAKAAWSYINMPRNAQLYTAAQLKRIKGRITKALVKFGVTIDSREHWLVDPVEQVTETALTEYYPDSPSGSFRVTLTNGPVQVTVSSYSVDPADLDLVGRAAMDGACTALAAIDPDMDGDMDVPGAGAEDTDGDMETSAPPPDQVVEDAPDPIGTPASRGGPDVSAPATAPTPAADHNQIEEEPDVSEPTTPAVEPQTPAAPAETPTTPPETPDAPVTVSSSGGVHMTDRQFEAMLAALRAPAMAAAETASPAPVATETAPVAETDEQRVRRLVAEGIQAALPAAVIEHVQANGGATRKGLVAQRPVTETAADTTVDSDDLGEHGLPADWPQKPLSKYTDAERRRYVGAALQDYVLGPRGQR